MLSDQDRIDRHLGTESTWLREQVVDVSDCDRVGGRLDMGFVEQATVTRLPICKSNSVRETGSLFLLLFVDVGNERLRESCRKRPQRAPPD